MRYAIDFDKTINQLVPYYLGGRKLILYLQALVKPLQLVNRLFVEYAKETRIEASMTSQIFYFEWFLNRRLGKYFLNSDEKIVFNARTRLGTPIYNANANVPASEHMKLHKVSENINSTKLYNQDERTDSDLYSFVVTSPVIDTSKISQEEYIAMLSHLIDKYRLSGKTYIINFNA